MGSFISFIFNKHIDKKLRCKIFASKHMRCAANILLKIRELDHSTEDFYLKPNYFDIVQRAAICLSGNDQGVYKNLPHPSALRNIGYEIKRHAELTEEIGITKTYRTQMEEAKLFLKLYKIRWTLLWSSAQKQLNERQFNKEVKLPTCADLTGITTYMKTEIHTLLKSFTIEDYSALAKLVEARLIMFNKRRPKVTYFYNLQQSFSFSK